MRLSLEHIDARLPVTSLKALVFGDARLLILGQGCYAQLIDEASGDVLARLRVFKRNHVHGFAILRQTEQGLGTGYFQLLVWGDRSLRLLSVTCAAPPSFEKLGAVLHAASAECLASDWVLDGCASAANDEANVAYLVTAHNAILGLNLIANDDTFKYKNTIHLQQLVTGVKSILFSADVIAISPSHILIAAGTVFGEIIVWSCFLNKVPAPIATGFIHHFFTGHEGSIFGVQMSSVITDLRGELPGRLLASCSDDRTVKIWDISDCENASPNDVSAYSTDGFELRCTGFGKVADETEVTGESCVASAFGHGARIWGIHFLPIQQGNQRKISLVSRGEDAHCFVWDLNWEVSEQQTSNFTLRNINSLRNHNGKHIWSLEMCNSKSGVTVYSGGADGAVKTFNLQLSEGEETVCLNRNNRLPASTDPGNANSRQKISMKDFAFVTPDCFLASTVAGEVQIGWVQCDNQDERYVTKETLFFEEDLRHYSIISSIPHMGMALIGNDCGQIRLYNHSLKSISKIADVGQRPVGLYALEYRPKTIESAEAISFVAVYAATDSADLILVTLGEDSAPKVERIPLDIPESFLVNCASLIGDNQHLALGSRRGALAVYRITRMDSLQPLLISRRVHGKDGINQITPFSDLFHLADSSLGYFLTCGRDGTYRVNELETLESPDQTLCLRTINLSPTVLHFDIEGAYVDYTSKNLMLYGFRGMEFVLWDETLQSEAARIKCGGSHRHWAFHPSKERSGEALFIWSQGGFNAFHIRAKSTRLLRAGSHGREIKSMGTFQSADGKKSLVVTGGEDTTLRIFTPNHLHDQGPWGVLKCARVLIKHDTGPQHVAWSKCGKLMFSSGGFEDFLVWKITSLPFFGLATDLVATGPKSHPNSEVRVMSFDILEMGEEQNEPSFLICLVYSNSSIRVFHYSSAARENGFILLANGTYTSNCLTQARFLLEESSLCLITASTDGYFTLWNLTSILEPFYQLKPTPRLKQSLDATSITPEPIVCENRYQIHSNSIKCLDLIHLSNTTTLVLTSGDDNSIALSLLNTKADGSDVCNYAGTISIPDAHAASVNSLRVIEQYKSEGEEKIQIFIASSGNDHQVKIWQIDINGMATDSLDGIHVQNVVNRYSPVADITSLDLLRNEEGMIQLLVGGVGMEIFQVNIN